MTDMLASLLHRLGLGWLTTEIAHERHAIGSQPIRTTSGLPRTTLASLRRQGDRPGVLLNVDGFR